MSERQERLTSDNYVDYDSRMLCNEKTNLILILTGFHDAIGDAISISITPKHLQGLGLIQKSVDDTAHDINFLFAMAMDKVSVQRLKLFNSAL